MAEEVQKRRSPWMYVGIGCAVALLLLCGVGLVIVVGGYKMASGWAEDMADPTRRENKARKQAMATLGGVPAGYSAAFSFGFPMVFEMLLFVDAPLLADGGPPVFTRLFTYWRFMETENTNQMKTYFEKPDAGTTFQSANLQVDTTEDLARGEFKHQGHSVMWVASRGNVRLEGQYDMQEGIVTKMYFQCPGDQVRVATWQMKEPAGGAGDLTGTVGDPNEMAKLLQPLSPCGK